MSLLLLIAVIGAILEALKADESVENRIITADITAEITATHHGTA